MGHRILNFAALVAVCIWTAGCCLPQNHAPPGYALQVKDNELLGFYAVHLRATEKGWRLSGRCYQGDRYQSTFRIVVAVEVLDAEAKLVERHYIALPGTVAS